MKEELDKALCEKYPKIFAQRTLAPHETCMCWGFACGDGWFNIIDALCGNIQWHIDQHNKDVERNKEYHAMRDAALAGDWSLFDERNKNWATDPRYAQRLEDERASLLNKEVPKWFCVLEPMDQVEAVQVKEKFGGLRFYTDCVPDDYIRGLISLAESLSVRTCEVCGAPGKQGGQGWIRTLCVKHSVEGDEDE